MIHWIIETSVRWRGLAVLLMVGTVVASVQIIRTMPVDAIPDLSDVQVIVFTEYPGRHHRWSKTR